MGIAKRAIEDEQGRGFSLNKDKTVCTNCFDDYALKNFIKDNKSHSSCSYCDDSDKDIIVCELDLVTEHILNGIRSEWGHPADEGLPYEGREGGWQVADVYNTWEVLAEELEVDIYSNEVYEDIINSILDTEWCGKDPYSLSTTGTLIFGWERFSDFVKNKARYVFFRARNPDYDENLHDEMNPVKILDTLGKIIKRNNLIKVVSVDTKIYRVRVVDPSETYKTATDLGSPPDKYAVIPNRMSPAGISMFYGAFNIETAIEETYNQCEEDKKAIAGIFSPIRPLSVIDLSSELFVPSIFDENKRGNRSYMWFLKSFIRDFTKPIDRSDRAHIDYVPTQVVIEYIRHVFTTNEDKQVDGVIYPSSKSDGEKAIVIFANSEQCIDEGVQEEDIHLLKLIDVEEYDLKGKV